MQQLRDIIKTAVDNKYKDKAPTEDQIEIEADALRKALSVIYPITDEEFEELKRQLPSYIVHSIGYADTLKKRDSAHQDGWYAMRDVDSYFWNRYKQYLGSKRSQEVIRRLDDTTNGIMDSLGDPQSSEPFQRRGLLLGDVQSGKTATYIGICNKAADVGYRVIIVLAGMMENLRIQTQERLDSDFVGLDSKYSLDKKADSSMKDIPVGVGKIPPFDKTKHITRFTSVTTDFKVTILNALGLNLNDLNGTALFVVKKNKSILNNLYKWLTKDEDVLNLPMLLIDDEADNASVNTNDTTDPDKNPTAINAAINKILRAFKQATYLGITATPFANIFIDPSISEDGAAKDLFPKDFLTLLPVPDNYIGTDKIFGEEKENGIDAPYSQAVVPISDDEQQNYYPFKHKKEIAYFLTDIPESMKEAIRYFILATAVSDLRFDTKEHRTMMINVSRYTIVQNKTEELVKEYLSQVVSDIGNYAMLPCDKNEKIPNIHELHDTWDKFGMDTVAGVTWEIILHEYLIKAAKRIQTRAVNQSTGAQSLDYYNYQNIGMRVIAIGGNSLSRGLTLEGLIVTYFYRNTMMYDTLLQMGRWFGYRDNYSDLFKLWMGEESVDWYGYITDAVNELKDELRTMARQHSSPQQFGLKVRQDPGYLIVTARNKMRSGTVINVPISVSGRMIETPRMWYNAEILKDNNELCIAALRNIETNYHIKHEYDPNVRALIWHNVPREVVVELVKSYRCHPWNLNFQPVALGDYIEKDPSLEYWDVGVPFGRDNDKAHKFEFTIGDESVVITSEERKLVKGNEVDHMLRVNGTHVRIGAGGCTKIGLSADQIDKAKTKFADNGKITDRTYLRQELNRLPLALIHVMHNSTKEDTPGLPEYIFGLGLGFPGGEDEETATYVVNTKELENYIDIDEAEDDD